MKERQLERMDRDRILCGAVFVNGEWRPTGIIHESEAPNGEAERIIREWGADVLLEWIEYRNPLYGRESTDEKWMTDVFGDYQLFECNEPLDSYQDSIIEVTYPLSIRPLPYRLTCRGSGPSVYAHLGSRRDDPDFLYEVCRVIDDVCRGSIIRVTTLLRAA